MKILQFIILFLAAAVISSCNSGPSTEEIFAEDTQEILTFLEENNLTDDVQVTSTGIYYLIINPGKEDKKPTLNSLITCNYKGYFPNGEVFDENDNVEFILGNTIEGWRQGIRLIGEGGTVRLFIPSQFCYGQNGTNGIPPNQVLFFDVDLLKV